jgi:hypothetical protein
MKLIVTIIQSVLIVSILSCSRHISMINRTFIKGDSIKTNSLSFLSDSLCVYKQEYLIDLPKPYKEVKNICHYTRIGNRIILKNMTSSSDSANSTCFQIPKSILDKTEFFTPPASDSIIIIGARPKLSRIDIYGYIDNITTDILKAKRHTIFYQKINKCFPYYMVTLQPFKERK